MLARSTILRKSGRIGPPCKHFRNVGTWDISRKCWDVLQWSNSIRPTCKHFRGESARFDVQTFPGSPRKGPPCKHFRDFANVGTSTWCGEKGGNVCTSDIVWPTCQHFFEVRRANISPHRNVGPSDRRCGGWWGALSVLATDGPTCKHFS